MSTPSSPRLSRTASPVQARPSVGSRQDSIAQHLRSPRTPEPRGVADDDDANDRREARLSPRRSQEEVTMLQRSARDDLNRLGEATQRQESLLALAERVEAIKQQTTKLEGENKFLQSYIGELMATSRITSTGAGKGSRSK